MTEAERQRKIAAALVGVAGLLDAIQMVTAEAGERIKQLERLAKEFEQGRYLPKDDTLPDRSDADPEASPA